MHYFEFHCDKAEYSQADGCDCRGSQPCPRVIVEEVQRVWASEKLPDSDLPLHRGPTSAWEKGQLVSMTFLCCHIKENTVVWGQVFYSNLLYLLIPELRALKLQTVKRKVCPLASQAEFVWHKLSADNMDPDFVERRRVGLENFLLRVASHPILSNDKILYHFLTEVLQAL